MLPETLKDNAVLAALDAWDPQAVSAGSLEFGETLLWIPSEKLLSVCRYLKETAEFVRLSGLSCIDRYPAEPRFEVFYLLHSLKHNQRLKLKVALPSEQPEVESVTAVWRGADWYEREAFDLFGVRFLNHPDLRRIMMPEDWQGHPLRRDFPVHGFRYGYQSEK